MKNNIKLGLGILTVLATPFAVDAANGSSEAHAAQDTVKNTQVAKTTNKEEVKTTTQKKYFSIYFMTFPHKFCTKRNLSKADTSSLLHPFRNKE